MSIEQCAYHTPDSPYSVHPVTPWVDATTIRGARAAGIVCAALLALIFIASVWVPDRIGTSRGEPQTSRMLTALILGMPLSLALALRDPVRNAGVLAVVGLGCGLLGATRVMNAYQAQQALTLTWYDGTVFVAGVDVRADPYGVKARIGVQLQSTAFLTHLSCAEVVSLFAACYDRAVDPVAVLAEVDLADRAKTRNETLSGGQRQRLSIATALVNDPQVLFLDEPTTGLDPQARRHLWDLVRKIRQRGTTVFLTTHYMDEAEVLCDRVAIMDRGKILRLDAPRILVGQLLARGFAKPVVQQQATLEDVFLDLTGHELRE